VTVELEAGIVVRDDAALRAFYTDVMGFALVDHLEHAAGTVWKLRRGDARLKLFKSRGDVEPPARVEPWYRPGGWCYAALYVDRPDDVDALAASVAAAGGAVLIEPTTHRAGARMALVDDPEGNVWELLAES
jgi:predicted enzyme related to lactoylglutathione lyase